MCYHVKLEKTQSELEKQSGKSMNAGLSQSYKPHYHLMGMQHPNCVLTLAERPEYLVRGIWGWVDFSQGKSPQDFYRTFLGQGLNAQSEKRSTYAAYKNAKRCLFWMDGFYESKKVNGKSYPHLIQRKDATAFCAAGIYATHGAQSYAAILTQAAFGLFGEIHNTKMRMPVILSEEKHTAYLNEGKLLGLDSDAAFRAHAVSKTLLQPTIVSDLPEITQEVYYPELHTLF